MKLTKHVLYAIDDADAGKFDSALMHACIAVDGTARRLYPKSTSNRVRYVNTLRQYYWLIEPMMGAGLDLEKSRFGNVPLNKNPTPDFADVIYEIFRCGHAHGDEVPEAFSVCSTHGPFGSTWEIRRGELHMPDRVIWALLSVSVLSEVNRGEKTTGTYYLSLAEERFPIKDWWGREDDFQSIAAKSNVVRVKLEGLDRLEEDNGDGRRREENLLIFNPPFLTVP
jgi:hypothetical protein